MNVPNPTIRVGAYRHTPMRIGLSPLRSDSPTGRWPQRCPMDGDRRAAHIRDRRASNARYLLAVQCAVPIGRPMCGNHQSYRPQPRAYSDTPLQPRLAHSWTRRRPAVWRRHIPAHPCRVVGAYRQPPDVRARAARRAGGGYRALAARTSYSGRNVGAYRYTPGGRARDTRRVADTDGRARDTRCVADTGGWGRRRW